MGRKKGVANKITTDMRAIVLEALDKLGGAEWLAKQAEKAPKDFMQMLSKMIPKAIDQRINESINLRVISEFGPAPPPPLPKETEPLALPEELE